jgi:hypothetical protein
MIILNEKIIEKFLHHLAGKLNISTLLLELNYPSQDIIKSHKDIEALFSLYKGVILEKPEITNNHNKIQELFENQGGKFILHNKEDFPKEKTILLYFLYEVTDNKTIITVNDNNIVYANNNDINNNMIHVVVNKIKSEWEELLTNPNIIFGEYKEEVKKIIFYFKKEDK